jgi:hypothetical protein
LTFEEREGGGRDHESDAVSLHMRGHRRARGASFIVIGDKPRLAWKDLESDQRLVETFREAVGEII